MTPLDALLYALQQELNEQSKLSQILIAIRTSEDFVWSGKLKAQATLVRINCGQLAKRTSNAFKAWQDSIS